MGAAAFFLTGLQTVKAQDEEMDWRMKQDLENIREVEKKVIDYKPRQASGIASDRSLYMVNEEGETWMQLAVSAKDREKWYRFHPIPAGHQKVFDNAFHSLSATVIKNIAKHKPGDHFFAIRNAEEEEVLLTAIPDLENLKIHKVGFIHQEWQPNGDGHPFKKGYVWASNPSSDASICYVYSVLLTQNFIYSFGQKIGDDRIMAKLVDKMIVGCPKSVL
jgi:hypothetical protein